MSLEDAFLLGVPKELPTLAEFARTIILVDGPRVGYLFDPPPYIDAVYEAIDTAAFNEIYIAGSVQSGKTLGAWTIPILYFACVVGEDVLIGCPTDEMGAKILKKRVRPVMEKNPEMRKLIQLDHGGGSRDGETTELTLTNGASIRVLSAAGRDAKRSSWTARLLFLTEVNRLDRMEATNEEGISPLEQMMARTTAYGDDALIIGESTVSNDRAWLGRKLNDVFSTGSEFEMRCPVCETYVRMERTDLVGIDDAETVRQARDKGRLRCRECAVLWEDSELNEARQDMRLVHARDGATELSMRWNCAHSPLLPLPLICEKEYKAKNGQWQDLAELERKQSTLWWTTATRSSEVEDPEEESNLKDKITAAPLPMEDGTCGIGIDIRKRQMHWVVMRVNDAEYYLAAHGLIEIPQTSEKFTDRLRTMLVDLRQSLSHIKALALVDYGYKSDDVLNATLNIPGMYGIKGIATTDQDGVQWKKKQSGDGWVVQESALGNRISADVFRWRRRLFDSIRADGRFRLHPGADDGLLIPQLLSESPGVDKKGKEIWIEHGQNHYWDAAVYSLVAASIHNAVSGGSAAVQAKKRAKSAQKTQNQRGSGGMNMPHRDGPYLTER